MIQGLIKQSYKFFYLLPLLLFLALLGFFYCAISTRPSVIFYLAGALGLSLWVLLLQRARLNRQLSALALQKQGYLEKINLIRAEMQKERQGIESTREKIVGFAHLKALTEKLCMSFTVAETSRMLMREVGQLFGTREATAILYFFDAKTGRLSLSCACRGDEDVNIKAKKGDIYDHWVVRNLKPLLVKDTKSDFRFDRDKVAGEEMRDFRSLMGVPMMLEDKTIGILRLDMPRENYFGTEEIRLLMTVGTIGAVAIDNAQLYERVEDLAIRDSLTGLFLRRYLLERLSQEIKRELRLKKEMAFLMIDLDHFKRYNDQYGHMAGDIVLKSVGLILLKMFDAPGNIVCRYGGEEFSVLLPDCSKEEARRRAEEFRKKVEGQTIILRRKKTKITVSVGVAVFPHDAQIKEELIQRADEALYKAKGRGRNKVCVV